jgi:exosome complex RNA-binding protein Rrp42 (RNase PH superfamily)
VSNPQIAAQFRDAAVQASSIKADEVVFFSIIVMKSDGEVLQATGAGSESVLQMIGTLETVKHGALQHTIAQMQH